jgi:hypothetical protein
MKLKQLVISLGISSALVLSACEKVIDVKPEFEVDGAGLFSSLKDYEFALTGTYSLFRQTGYYGNGSQITGAFSVLPDLMSEHVVETEAELGNFVTQTDWIYAADDNDIGITWVAAYKIITQANIVLQNLDQFAAAEPQRVNRIKGQALAIRALVHFDLLRYWGEEYDRNSTKRGIPYRTKVDAEEMPSRLTVKASYDHIFEDLIAAEGLLANVDKTINSAAAASSARTYIDQLVVRAIMARAYLYAKDYAKAEEYATKVIDARPLASKADFPAIWKDASVSEVIWSASFNAGEGNPVNSLYGASSNNLGYKPAAAVTDLYDQANDVRFPAYFASRKTGSTAVYQPFAVEPRKIVNKHIGRGSASDNVVNWKAFRTGEMYLIRAEARAMQGAAQAILGLKDLNDLRAARITNYLPVVLTGQNLLDAIAVERQKELFGEGHRWFDVKRTTRTIVRTDCGEASKCSLLPDNRAWTWPIPQGEVLANPNINPEHQTTGY